MKRFLPFLILVGMIVFASSAFTVSANGDCTFTLFGSAQPATDPENASNEVVAIDGSVGSGGINKVLPAGTQIDEIDNQVNVKYFFETPKTCTLGSPRISLRVDTDGDGDVDFNAHGNLGPLAFGGGCVTGTWTFADLTDAAPRWDTTQSNLIVPGSGSFTHTWDQMELMLAATYPNHQIIRGTLIEDGYPGIGYYDLLTIGDCTLDGPGDLAPPAVGPPTNADQCKNGGWETFNTPRTFKNQGDCIQYVNTGK